MKNNIFVKFNYIALVCVVLISALLTSCLQTDPETTEPVTSVIVETTASAEETTGVPETTKEIDTAVATDASKETDTSTSADATNTDDTSDVVSTDDIGTTDTVPSDTTASTSETTASTSETTASTSDTSAAVTTTTVPETTVHETTVVDTAPVHVHKYTTKTIASTCTTKGYTLHTCSCGNSYKDNYTEVKAHTYKNTVTPATCTTKGYTTHTCSVCGSSYRDSEKAALGHQWNSGVVTKPATATATGIKTYTCTRSGCKEMKTEVIPIVVPHTHSYTSTVVKPTCTEEGYKLYTCSSCGYTYRGDVVAALGHNYGKIDYLVGDEVFNYCTRPYCTAGKSRPATKWDKAVACEDNWEMVRERIIYYINEYRKAEGVAPLTELTGKGRQFTKIRSQQLVNDYSHNIDDIRAAAAQLEYGRYRSGENGYWDPDIMEAIAATSPLWEEGIDSLAYGLATMLHNSSAHWSYLGSAKYTYIAVGATESNVKWYAAVAVGRTNQYE